MNTVKKHLHSPHGSNVPKEQEHTSTDRKSKQELLENLSPELVPIVTLLTVQQNRRYYDGIFMLYHDLDGEGRPAGREWQEVYGILTGNQLAYWQAATLIEFKNNPDGLLEASAKPKYLNFTDSVYNALKTLPAAKRNLENIIVVSTTLKNRFLLQLKTYNDLVAFYSALRLSNFEYTSLQEAYTASLLSSRGSRLSDIRTILSEKRYDHEDWVSIRYGSGMAWQRCYAVIEPSVTKRKSFTPGRILLYESEQKKKKQLLAVIVNASSVAAVYPSSPLLIDHSTLLKMEASVNYLSPSLSSKISKKYADDFTETSIFFMPQQHSSVPGFDTLIRFLICLMDSFGLYGRPKRLKAERSDQESLLFGLPTLPHVHYLDLDDISLLASRGEFFSWDAKLWKAELKRILKSKIDRGYEGCGHARGFSGSTAGNRVNSGAFNDRRAPTPPTKDGRGLPGAQVGENAVKQGNIPRNNQSFQPPPPPQHKTPQNDNGAPNMIPGTQKNPKNLQVNTQNTHLNAGSLEDDNNRFSQISEIYHKYSKIRSPSDQFHDNRNQLLNGSVEEFEEDDLPGGIRRIDLDEKLTRGMYPKNDDDLFSEEEGSDRSESKSISESPKEPRNLQVPSYQQRNSSYSSVQSPTVQYNEFNEQFRNAMHKEGVEPPYPKPGSGSNPSSGNMSPVRLNEQQRTGNIAKSSPLYNLADNINQHSSAKNAPAPPVQGGAKEYPRSAPGNSQSNPSVPALVTPHAAPYGGPGMPRHIASPNSSQNNLAAQNTGGKYKSSIAPDPSLSTVAPSMGYQQPPPQQYIPGPYKGGPPRPQNSSSRMGPSLPGVSQPVKRAPQPAPQPAPQQAYPQSSQFGYQPQATPAPAPQQSRPPAGGPRPAAGGQQYPRHPYAEGMAMQPVRYHPQRPANGAVQAGIPPSVSTSSGFQHQNLVHNQHNQHAGGFIPRSNNPQASASHHARRVPPPAGPYQYSATAGLPPSVNIYNHAGPQTPPNPQYPPNLNQPPPDGRYRRY
ncbi:Piso0_005605 [Millerozyma farinosa CBS 7064]|uniref:Piso0_005605 protein n=1 Tax=Pichia sorbitophila (strain ATCC MYA-4447 / BCRC 22081 / CBS 7064 / NBRC 10061 / NRRL Y-12695) TaxID=559304 RepID=G8Y2F2_PICSO|nr:Piso0_005605 [Millerozyma farinosa CBS 7064]